VSFDDTCRLCRSSVAWLRRLDWLGRFRFVPIQHLPRAAPGLQIAHPEQLERALHVFGSNGTVVGGARALRFIGMRLPLLTVPTLGLYLPFALRGAERAYAWVSTRRHALSRRWFCQANDCDVSNSRSPGRDVSG